tara:strand:- start:11216 stop:12529 length:1314 start_codon:yes stop_codon:yes gene_type:complete
MIEKIQKYISEKDLFSKDANLLLAISGGADSMSLFFSLKALGYRFELAHCNFNLRGKESDEDESFVKDLAHKNDVKCHVKSFDTQEYADINKVSIQMAARDLRYKWFDELTETKNIDFVITAHHKDDNVETFLINLIRGSGINGLSGIKYKNKKIIRPLLEISRDEIQQYLIAGNIKYRHDSSNTDIKYLRNKIRHNLIPILQDMNPNIQNRITEQISILDGMNRFFQKKINSLRSYLISEERGVYKINIASLIELVDSEVILFEILKPFGFSQADQIFKAIGSQSGRQFFSKTHQLIIDRNTILIALLDDLKKEIEISELEKEIHTPFKMKFAISTDLIVSRNPNIAYLDFSKISFPLKLRKWKNGDKFIPFGMRNFKKLSDFFIDEKYSILDKKTQWILCSGDDIIWIVGRRIDDRYKIENHTKKAYIAEILKRE